MSYNGPGSGGGIHGVLNYRKPEEKVNRNINHNYNHEAESHYKNVILQAISAAASKGSVADRLENVVMILTQGMK